MDILIQANGVVLTEDVRGLIEEKISRVEDLAPRAVRVRVCVRKASARPSPRQYVVRLLVEIPGADLAAEESGADVVSALDIVAGKIERRLRKRKTERLARRTRTPRTRE